jgi:hypothetical protein
LCFAIVFCCDKRCLSFGNWGPRSGIELVLNSKVEAVEKGSVTVVNSLTGEREQIPFGACVWATGVAMHPLIKQLQVEALDDEWTNGQTGQTDSIRRLCWVARMAMRPSSSF